MTMANRVWIMVLTPVWLGMILLVFYTSQDTAWGGGYWERRVMDYLRLDREIAHSLVFTARKAVHFSYYGLLALLSQVCLRLWSVKRPSLTAGLGVVMALTVAVADEYWQSLTDFRSGKLGDVALDLAGALCFTVLAGWVRRKVRLARERRRL